MNDNNELQNKCRLKIECRSVLELFGTDMKNL
jgi:hypothetical protein